MRHLISQLSTLCLHDASTCPAHSHSAVLQVKFSTKSFGRDAAHVAAAAIENIAATLEHADISDIIAGRPVSSTSSMRGMCMHESGPSALHIQRHPWFITD